MTSAVMSLEEIVVFFLYIEKIVKSGKIVRHRYLFIYFERLIYLFLK